jgi:hypothetical protein
VSSASLHARASKHPGSVLTNYILHPTYTWEFSRPRPGKSPMQKMAA